MLRPPRHRRMPRWLGRHDVVTRSARTSRLPKFQQVFTRVSVTFIKVFMGVSKNSNIFWKYVTQKSDRENRPIWRSIYFKSDFLREWIVSCHSLSSSSTPTTPYAAHQGLVDSRLPAGRPNRVGISVRQQRGLTMSQSNLGDFCFRLSRWNIPIW